MGIVITIIIIMAAVLIYRYHEAKRLKNGGKRSPRTPMQEAAERFKRGEISEEELERIRKELS
ncbi:MAG: SHOCT domain-containing protein [Spirochaetota bacterium]